MNKVKVFVVKQGLSHPHEKLEYQINHFLEENDVEVIDIKYSTCCHGDNGRVAWIPSAMLIYKTKE